MLTGNSLGLILKNKMASMAAFRFSYLSYTFFYTFCHSSLKFSGEIKYDERYLEKTICLHCMSTAMPVTFCPSTSPVIGFRGFVCTT